jgi:hypothetical protein
LILLRISLLDLSIFKCFLNTRTLIKTYSELETLFKKNYRLTSMSFKSYSSRILRFRLEKSWMFDLRSSLFSYPIE